MSGFGFARANILRDPSLAHMFTPESASTQNRTRCVSEPTNLRLHSRGKDLQGRHGIGRPGVVVNCCPSVLECRDAVACSEVPAFRYESALDPAEQETAERGTSARCSVTSRPSPVTCKSRVWRRTRDPAPSDTSSTSYPLPASAMVTSPSTKLGSATVIGLPMVRATIMSTRYCGNA